MEDLFNLQKFHMSPPIRPEFQAQLSSLQSSFNELSKLAKANLRWNSWTHGPDDFVNRRQAQLDHAKLVDFLTAHPEVILDQELKHAEPCCDTGVRSLGKLLWRAKWDKSGHWVTNEKKEKHKFWLCVGSNTSTDELTIFNFVCGPICIEAAWDCGEVDTHLRDQEP